MNLDPVLQEYSIYATLTGILGGFAVAAVMQLVESERRGKLVTALTIIFSIATFMFLLALLVFVVSYAVITETYTTITDEMFTQLSFLAALALYDTFGAVFVLLAGIGLAGWVRSKATGIVTTILAAVFMCMSLSALIWVFQILGSAATTG